MSNCLEGCLCGRGPTKKIHLERKREGATRPPPSNVNNVGNIDSIDENLVPLGEGFFRKRFLQRLETTTTTTTSLIFGHGLGERMNSAVLIFCPTPGFDRHTMVNTFRLRWLIRSSFLRCINLILRLFAFKFRNLIPDRCSGAIDCVRLVSGTRSV